MILKRYILISPIKYTLKVLIGVLWIITKTPCTLSSVFFDTNSVSYYDTKTMLYNRVWRNVSVVKRPRFRSQHIQLPITPAPGVQKPSSELHNHQAHMMHIDAQGGKTIINIKLNKHLVGIFTHHLFYMRFMTLSSWVNFQASLRRILDFFLLKCARKPDILIHEVVNL